VIKSVCYVIISKTSTSHFFRTMTLSMTVRPCLWSTIKHLSMCKNGKVPCHGRSMLT